MCGITGVYGLSDTQSVQAMLSKIKHRGPDANGYFVAEKAGIVWGHCRLSIMDPEGGDQPIYNEDNSISIVANGEIYNSKQIRKHLEQEPSDFTVSHSADAANKSGDTTILIPPHSKRHIFSTTSDTECILHLYEEFGTDLVHYLDGMYTFAIVDKNKPKQQQIMVARDPIGIKPLYYAEHESAVWFTSEAKSLAEVELGTATTAQIQIREFPPGHYYTPAAGLNSFYSVPDIQPAESPASSNSAHPATSASLATPTSLASGPQAFIRQLRRTLEESVEKRLMSDVPLGCFLSGGLDSSIITAVVRRRIDRPIHTFSVGFEGSPDLLAARSLAETLDTIHHEFVITDRAITEHLPDIIYHLESFDQDLVRSAIPTYFTARLAAEHVKVILTGEGADELFAGYTYYKDIDEIEEYLHNELRRSVETLHNINLQRVDRLTMAHSIEGRVPFLDLEMIKLAQKIPAEYKLYGYASSVESSGGKLSSAGPKTSTGPKCHAPEPTEKWILRKAFEDMLPAEIVWRRKEQFDEGSGTAGIMPRLAEQAMSDGEYRRHTARNSRLKLRSKEEAYYHQLFDNVYTNAQSVLQTVGRWTDRPDWI